MASLKPKFRPSTVHGVEGSIFYQAIHNRKVRQFTTSFHIFPSEWDSFSDSLIIPGNGPRRDSLLEINNLIRRDIARFSRIVKKMEATGLPFSLDEIIAEYNRYSAEYTLFTFCRSLITKLSKRGQTRTSETYALALASFRKFHGDNDIMLDAITPSVMEEYADWLRARGVTPNTLSFYTRILRAVYNRAVDQDIIDDCSPFRHVYTGVEKTVKRALPISFLSTLKNLDLSASRQLCFARDMFLLSFYLRGMSFIDMAFLRKVDLCNGYIIYRRRKTGQQLTIAWTEEMQEILDRYPANRSPYLLPIIRKNGLNERCAYRNAGCRINRALRQLAPLAGIPGNLTLYVARHSWASVAKAKGVPLSIISEGMGHDNETTTRIYLASLDTSLLDQANSLIIKSI